MTAKQRPCRLPDCSRVVKARELCNAHYLRNLRHGSPMAGAPPRVIDDEERLWPQIERTDDCWLWTGGRTGSGGYGVTIWRGEQWRVHRLVYTLLVGPIPDGLQLDHLCRIRLCCRPDHLEPVTQQENIRRGERATRLTCAEGHPYDVQIARRGGIERRCSRCTNARRRARRECQRRSAS